MRIAAIAFCALIGASAAGSALAGGLHEPPDPCRPIHTGHAHTACQQRHARLMDGSVHFGDGSVHFRTGRTTR